MSIHDALTIEFIDKSDRVVRRDVRRSSRDLGEPDVLPLPTGAIPGTREKIAVLRARLAAGVSLHHPDDVRITAGWVARTFSPMRFRCRD